MLFSGEVQLTDPDQRDIRVRRGICRQGPPKTATAARCVEFDLTRRLFKYPCSYLEVYSEQFDGLPP